MPTTTETTVKVNRASEFANWLLALIGGTDRLRAMKICIECSLKRDNFFDEDSSVYANFVSKCKSKGEPFCRKIGWVEENWAFVGFNLLLQEEFYLLWIDADKIEALRPYDDEKQAGLLRMLECSADDIIAWVEDAIEEKAELEEVLRREIDGIHNNLWVCRTKTALQKACDGYKKPAENLLKDFEKLIAFWRQVH